MGCAQDGKVGGAIRDEEGEKDKMSSGTEADGGSGSGCPSWNGHVLKAVGCSFVFVSSISAEFNFGIGYRNQ